MILSQIAQNTAAALFVLSVLALPATGAAQPPATSTQAPPDEDDPDQIQPVKVLPPERLPVRTSALEFMQPQTGVAQSEPPAIGGPAPTTARARPQFAARRPQADVRRAPQPRATPSASSPRTTSRRSLSRSTEAPKAASAGDGQQLYPRRGLASQALYEARRTYEKTGRAEVVETGGTKIYPYGGKMPIIETTAMRVTLVELAPNEYITKAHIGDDARWVVESSTSGGQSDFTQYVAIKPLDCGITTNLALPTSQGRLYQMTLDAAPCDLETTRNPQEQFTAHVKWWYPGGTTVDVRRPSQASPIQNASRSRRGGKDIGPAQSMPSISVEDANTGYDVDADRGFPCPPTMVADDGERMYVRFPSGPMCQETYPLFAQGEDGGLQLMNYDVFSTEAGARTYVTDSVPVRAVLQYTTDDEDERRVEITNEHLKELRRRR